MPCGPPVFNDELRESARAYQRWTIALDVRASCHRGYGSGTACHLCGQPIEPHQVEYEVSNAREGRSFSFQ